MGLFSKPEVTILKESSDAKLYLSKLQELYPQTTGALKKELQKEIAITKAGITGEDNILFELKNSNMDMVVLHDIYIETNNGLGAQIDFVVICSKLIFIIECKNLFGNIEIDSKGNFIRTIEIDGKKQKEGIYSPITQNEHHMSVFKEWRSEDKNVIWGAALRETFHLFYKSLVVLANPRTVINDRFAKKEVKEQVLRCDQLIRIIKTLNSESKGLPSGKKEMLEIAENILKGNIEERKDYFVKYQDILTRAKTNTVNTKEPKERCINDTEMEQTESKSLICPKCGSKLVLRTAKKGTNVGQKFYGCANFPKCRYVSNIK